MNRRRPDFFAAGALATHAALAFCLRTIAWPEVTTPGYLIARGLVLYRDVKFVHTPLLMETLGASFALFGVRTSVVRLFALLWPLLAHAAILRETRADATPQRALTSAFFLVVFYGWQGNSVWPTVMICALAIPIARALGRGRSRSAGILIGLAILMKQTAAYLLIVVVVRLLAARRVRETAVVATFASLPFAVAWLLFAFAGAGWHFLEWTLLVPFRDLYGTINIAPTLAAFYPLLIAFVPITIECFLERPGEAEVATRWYLLVAIGLCLMVYPRFSLLQAVASVPCLAVGAARLLRRTGGVHAAALALVATIVLTMAAILAMGERWTGEVLFWNEDPAFNALAARLRTYAADTPLVTDLWANILPRSGLMPPGRLYVHPWLTYLGPIDQTRERIARAASVPGTLVVSYRREARGQVVGPFVIETR